MVNADHKKPVMCQRRLHCFLSLVLGVAIVVSGCQQPKVEPQPVEVPEVVVTAPRPVKLPEYLEVTGRIDAERVVEIRSRVTGYLTRVAFQDGQFVTKGDPLYEIDNRPARARLDETVGVIEQLLGEQRFLKIQVDRFEKLVAKGAASQQDFDSYKAKIEENAGALIAARAQHEAARLNVEFCSISAPITGQIGRTQLQVGNLIAEDTTTLTTIVSIDPIFVYFNVDEPTFLRVMGPARHLGERPGLGQRVTVADVGLVDDVDRQYPYRSQIDFLNNQIDTKTATITMRGRLDNPYSADPAAPRPPLFRPGMFARVRLPLGEPVERMVVPEKAIGSIQDRKIVWTVGADELVVANEVTLGQKLGSWIAVAATDPARRLTVRDRIVVRGLQRCREGKPVSPTVAPESSLDLTSLVLPTAAPRQGADKPAAALPPTVEPTTAPQPAAVQPAGLPATARPEASSAVETLPPPGNPAP